MSTQAQVEKEGERRVGELLGEIRAKVVSQTIKEITPLGIKIEFNGRGEFAGGKLNSVHTETVNLFQRTDGTFEWETKALERTREGDIAVVSARGTGRSTGPTTVSGEGEGIYLTQSPSLSWLNGLRTKAELNANLDSGEYQVKVRTK